MSESISSASSYSNFVYSHQTEKEKILYEARACLMTSSLNSLKVTSPILKTINEYLGYDESQFPTAQDMIFLSTFHLECEEIRKEIANNKKHWTSRETQAAKDLLSSVEKNVASLDFLKNAIDVDSLSTVQQQLIPLKLMRSFAQSAFEYSDLYKKQGDFLKAITHTLAQASAEETLSNSSRSQLEISVTELITSQQMVGKLLSAPTIQSGASSGILLKIMKNNKTRGYLFGTMHYLVTPKMQEAMDLSETVQKKLYECAILGTEVAITEKITTHPDPDSVEKRLLEWASNRGIMNVGIDAENRDSLYKTLSTPSKTKTSIKENIRILDSTTDAYCSGNVSSIQHLVEENQTGDNDQDREVQTIRNLAMSKNIDAFLQAFEKVGKQMKIKTPKGFFAAGFAHLLATKFVTKAIPEMLAEMGWTLQLVRQEPTQSFSALNIEII